MNHHEKDIFFYVSEQLVLRLQTAERVVLQESDIIVAYVNHSWGGAAKTLQYAAEKESGSSSTENDPQTVDKAKSTVNFFADLKNKRKKEDRCRNNIHKQEKQVEDMLRERREKQQHMDLVILEQLVPENHLLRKILI